MKKTYVPFKNREEAGRLLSELLRSYRDRKDTIVLSLIRGGVVVGHAIAKELHLPHYPYIVRKIGHPYHREFAVGAMTEDEQLHLDEETIGYEDIDKSSLQNVIDEELKELRRRKEKYMVSVRPDLKGMTVILTDDGAATGATLFATIKDLKKREVKRIIVALPVAPPEVKKQCEKDVDETVILETPVPFNAVGAWYLDFPQVEDEEVQKLLKS